MAQVGAQPAPRMRPTTWRFDLTLRLPAFSSAEDVRLVFLAILEDAQGNRSIPGLQDLSYSYHVPEHGGRELHTDICTPQARLARPLSKDGYSTIE